MGETDEAIVVLETLLEELSTRLGPGHVTVGVTLNRLGASRSQRGEVVAAGRHYQRALDIFETQLGLHHSQTLITVGGLGHVAQVQGDFAKARAMYRRVARGLDGQRDVKRADILNNLGVIALELGDLDAAVQRYQTAIDVYTVVLGRTHPHVGIALFGLGYAHLQREEPDAAIAALEEALAISIRDDPTQGRRPSETRLWLAQALLAAGRDPQRTRAMLENAAKGFEALGVPAVDRLHETQRVLADLK
ncbi:MAG: tetratricopeptide repeat protein [Nannocystaceae bacterium]|nr:tetratricopeptide repeat protein [Nannocystaceae bacterium]